VWTHFIGFLIFAVLTAQYALYTPAAHEHALNFATSYHPSALMGILSDVHNYNFTEMYSWEFEQFAYSRIHEMKGYVRSMQHQLNSKMYQIHENFDHYMKDFEMSLHDLQQFHPHFPDEHFKSKALEMKLQLQSTFEKYFLPQTKLPLIVFLASAMICFMGSALYHTFGCASKGAYYFFLKVDYSGISVLIAGSIVPFVCYTFHELSHWRIFYLITLSVVCVAVIYVSFAERFSADEYQPYRALLFVLMACMFVVPLCHMFALFGNVDKEAIVRFVGASVLYTLGVLSYVLRCPERLFPGKFDIWLHSHQIFHIFIVAAAVMWYTFALRLWQIHAHTFTFSSPLRTY